MFPAPASPARLAALEAVIDTWLGSQLIENPAVASVERVAARQWYVRCTGEQKATFSALFTLGQRTLRYESHLLPAPEENHGALYHRLLCRNHGLYGLTLAIGDEEAVFLVGQLDVRHVDETELDRVLGSIWVATEQFFRPAMRLGFASKFSG